jgi:hypothetical protein
MSKPPYTINNKIPTETKVIEVTPSVLERFPKGQCLLENNRKNIKYSTEYNSIFIINTIKLPILAKNRFISTPENKLFNLHESS